MAIFVKYQPSRRSLITFGILAAGLTASLLSYFFHGDDPNSLPLGTTDTKKFTHDLQTIGGNYSVVAENFMNWFDGLWRGEALSYNMALLTILTAALYFFVSSKND